MKLLVGVMTALLAIAAATPTPAQNPDIVVRGDAKRMEIERILTADNLDTTKLAPTEVAERIAAILRGRAPRDFWLAYRAHVAAWRRLAHAVDAAHGRGREAPQKRSQDIIQAEQAIEATFDEVERIARSYGARLPTPPSQVLPTV